MTRVRAAAVGAVLLGLAGCGVPTGGHPTTIAASDVPYGLASPSSGATAPPSAQSAVESSLVFLLAEDGRLVPRPRDVGGSARRDRLALLLRDLASGPTAAERDEHLSTGLPPDVRLTVAGMAGATATIDIELPAEAPTGWASRRAVAQIVLTATTVPGVEAVLLTLAGEPVEAPLPSGELTTDPLTAADVDAFLDPPAPPSAVPAPTDAPAETAVPASPAEPSATSQLPTTRPRATIPTSPQTPPPR
jgi:hypothetical protein